MKKATADALLLSKEFLLWSPDIGRSLEEPCYTIKEIAEAWKISEDLARDTFADEPGVLKFERPATKIKRAYSLLRVPESVLVRVHRRLTARG